MFRADYKTPLYEKAEGMQVSSGDEFNLALASCFRSGIARYG